MKITRATITQTDATDVIFTIDGAEALVNRNSTMIPGTELLAGAVVGDMFEVEYFIVPPPNLDAGPVVTKILRKASQ